MRNSNRHNRLLPVYDFVNKQIIFHHKGSILTISEDNKMKLQGSERDIAQIIIMCLPKQFTIYKIYNAAVIENNNGKYSLTLLAKDKPVFWNKLSEEFNKLMKLKCFW